MDEGQREVAARCLAASYDGTMDFPSIVHALMGAGFEGYEVDYRLGRATYFLPNGEFVELGAPKTEGSVAAAFDAAVVERAVREAQQNAPGYSYPGFCRTVKAAGCAGYMVSFSGRRVLYFGRTAETHVEHFPR
ncbi:DUF1398 family protein [Myxococcota bacterium]|nr:DUF1398 family protein [Myxococcota bacterium]